MKTYLCYCLAVLLILILSAGGAGAEVVVVMSAKSAVVRLTAEQTARIFLGKVKGFQDGSTAIAFDQPEGAPIRDEFYAKVVGKNAAQLTAYWAKVIFTGGDSYPPTLLEGNAAVRRAVAGNPNAIGYIDKNFVDSSVRIILNP